MSTDIKFHEGHLTTDKDDRKLFQKFDHISIIPFPVLCIFNIPNFMIAKLTGHIIIVHAVISESPISYDSISCY